MKCNAILYFVTRGKKPIVFDGNASQERIDEYMKRYTVTRTERCEGEIEAEVSAELEPEWGGSYARLVVTYRCKKCGWSHYGNLPDEYNISEWLTQKIKEL